MRTTFGARDKLVNEWGYEYEMVEVEECMELRAGGFSNTDRARGTWQGVARLKFP